MKNSIFKYIGLVAIITIMLLALLTMPSTVIFIVSALILVGLIYILTEINSGRKTPEYFLNYINSILIKIKSFFN